MPAPSPLAHQWSGIDARPHELHDKPLWRRAGRFGRFGSGPPHGQGFQPGEGHDDARAAKKNTPGKRTSRFLLPLLILWLIRVRHDD